MRRLASFAVNFAFATSFVFPAAAGEVQVTIESYAFSPVELRLKAGDRVAFLNRDEAPHNIVDMKGGFRSPALDTGERFARVFDKPGEIVYFCSLHPQMKGRIVVAP